MTKKIERTEKTEACRAHLRSIYDTLDLLSGKWKIAVIASLSFIKKGKFMELKREVDGIGSKMLSQVLRELELNGLIKRTVYDTRPITVAYELTPYGETLEAIILEMARWGQQHRKQIFTEKIDAQTPAVS